jgi:hypothetical protein
VRTSGPCLLLCAPPPPPRPRHPGVHGQTYDTCLAPLVDNLFADSGCRCSCLVNLGPFASGVPQGVAPLACNSLQRRVLRPWLATASSFACVTTHNLLPGPFPFPCLWCAQTSQSCFLELRLWRGPCWALLSTQWRYAESQGTLWRLPCTTWAQKCTYVVCACVCGALCPRAQRVWTPSATGNARAPSPPAHEVSAWVSPLGFCVG